MLPSSPGPSINKVIAAVALAVALLVEFLVKPRLELPASRVCPRCDRCNPESARGCVFCGREWLTDEGPRYAPFLVEIPAARAAHRRGITAMFVLCAVTYIPILLYPTRFSMAAFFVVIYYAYVLITGFMLKRTHLALIEHSGRLCTHCTYPLLESMPQCPECGVAGSVKYARRAWAQSGLWHPDEATAREMVIANEPRA
jgi:RNA polymerase subunit RPABC4/transcription elongation factor Spt4